MTTCRAASYGLAYFFQVPMLPQSQLAAVRTRFINLAVDKISDDRIFCSKLSILIMEIIPHKTTEEQKNNIEGGSLLPYNITSPKLR